MNNLTIMNFLMKGLILKVREFDNRTYQAEINAPFGDKKTFWHNFNDPFILQNIIGEIGRENYHLIKVENIFMHEGEEQGRSIGIDNVARDNNTLIKEEQEGNTITRTWEMKDL